jgi:hypothetical protein
MDPDLDGLLGLDQYSLPDPEKAPILAAGLNRLTRHHLARSTEYARILGAVDGGAVDAVGPADVPYIPVSLFKWLTLRSIEEDDVFKVMTSSGTTGQVPSRIYLDVETARLQTRALSSIVTHYLGPSRLPMLLVDHPGVVADRRSLSARGAGILGMMSYGRDHHYVLDGSMHVCRPELDEWLAQHAGQDILLFGFTFMVWQALIEDLPPGSIDLSRGTLIHSGGWKKLAERSVSRGDFRARLRDAVGLERVHDFYGMVEQVGSVFFECPAGYLHPPNFADIVIRDQRTWQALPPGTAGVVEVLSLLPLSYPGHALLTEDIGVVAGVDDCPCGRMGRRFTILGRVPKVEIRGCSDTHDRRD